MDVKIAAQMTLEHLPKVTDLERKEHLAMMLNKIMTEGISSTGDPVKGEKAHRWIGFVQGQLEIYGIPLEELKRICHEA